MSRGTALAPAKVNTCLFLGGRRADGRHELVTVYESISLADSLTLTVCREGADRVICPGVSGPNLVSGALAGLRAAEWDGPPVLIDVVKRIPVAAGLGGGSADAAAALRLAGAVAPVTPGVLASVARALGADVAGQLAPGVSLGTGAGDVVKPLAALAEHAWLILPAAVGLSTADVYREADRLGLARSPSDLAEARRWLEPALRAGAVLPGELLVNDLERAALSLYPPISRALLDAREAGADHAVLAGSGPTVAGLFWGRGAEQRAAAAVAALAGRYSGACVAVPVAEPVGAPQFR